MVISAITYQVYTTYCSKCKRARRVAARETEHRKRQVLTVNPRKCSALVNHITCCRLWRDSDKTVVSWLMFTANPLNLIYVRTYWLINAQIVISQKSKLLWMFTTSSVVTCSETSKAIALFLRVLPLRLLRSGCVPEKESGWVRLCTWRRLEEGRASCWTRGVGQKRETPLQLVDLCLIGERQGLGLNPAGLKWKWFLFKIWKHTNEYYDFIQSPSFFKTTKRRTKVKFELKLQSKISVQRIPC